MKSTLRSTKLCFTIQQEEQKALKQTKAKKKKRNELKDTQYLLPWKMILF